jgi:hypothetical protein
MPSRFFSEVGKVFCSLFPIVFASYILIQVRVFQGREEVLVKETIQEQ